jgi:hypothetical protein
MSDEQWEALKDYLNRYADRLTSDIRDQFDGLLSIWAHPWELPEVDRTPSEAKELLETFRKATSEAATAAASLISSGSLKDAISPETAQWTELLQNLASAQELAARAAGRIREGKTGVDTRDNYAFVEQIEEILFLARMRLVNSGNKGSDFVGFVMCLMNIAGLAPPEHRRTQDSGPRGLVTRTYANSLLRTHITGRNKDQR